MKAEIKKLLDKYFEGDTTLEEEYVLRQYMLDHDNAEEYQEMSELFEMMDAYKNVKADTSETIHFTPKMHKSESKESFTITMWRGAIAASILLIAGFGLGWMYGGVGKIDASEIYKLTAEVKDLKKNVMVSGLHEPSVSSRIQAAYEISEHIDTVDDKILDALIYTLNSDPNNNVRLAASEALFKYSTSNKVRDAFISSLTNQNDPMIKIKLIDMLVALGEKRALPELQKVMKDNSQMKMVKDRAAQGISRLI